MGLFVELVRVALGTRPSLSTVPSIEDWQNAYLLAEKHALVGLLFSAIEKLNEQDKTYMPPTPLLYQWMGETLQIENRNVKVNYAAEQLTSIVKDGGLRSCVLKGQGIARLYPKPERRQSGDIDLWVEGGREKVLKFLKNGCLGTGHVVIHHVDARIIDGVDTEIHFLPVYACNPILHHKLQKFFRRYSDVQFSNYDKELGFSYPTLSFNAVYILAHIYMHFLYEGIGLRQIIDYYYVLKNLGEDERKQSATDIKEAGLKKFAGAAMYVLKQVCGMDETLFVAELDNRRGTLLLEEIMRSGNFGKYDDRLSGRDENNLISFNLVALKRQMSFFRFYPMDILSIPFFKIWHWCWRLWKGYL